MQQSLIVGLSTIIADQILLASARKRKLGEDGKQKTVLNIPQAISRFHFGLYMMHRSVVFLAQVLMQLLMQYGQRRKRSVVQS